MAPTFHDAEPAAQAPLEHSGWQKRLESAKSSRFPADQMAKFGRFARHDPTHACSDLGSVDSLFDVARQTLSESAPQFLIDVQRRAHHVRIRRKVGSNESRFYERDTDAEGSQLHPQYVGVALESVLGG
jgi:hypothetical protein